jgi:putative drug exporter of the RND superfamily
VPLAFGTLTVLAGRGVLSLLSGVMTIDALSLVVCTMMGLALGVDYSLLIVSRFREELGAGKSPGEAARATRASAGHTTFAAGATLIVALVFSAFLQPGSLLLSLATATAVVAAISVVISNVALPPFLALLGERINAGRIDRSRRDGTGSLTVSGMVATALRRPALAACLVALPLVLLALPLLGFTTGAPGISELSKSSAARQSAETIDRAVGPGWESPFVLVAATAEGPITTHRDLALLARWQRRIAAQPGVRAVIGPAPVAKRVASVRALGSKLVDSGGTGGGLRELGPGLRRAAGAVGKLRAGLDESAAGSGLLAEGSSRAATGAATIATQLRRAARRGEAATSAITRIQHGTKQLGKGQRRASVAGLTLTLGLRSLVPRIRGGELARARKLAHQLEAAAATDPSLRSSANTARVLARTIAGNRDEVRRLRETAQILNAGLNRLVPGGKRLESGVGQLAESAGGLSEGLEALGGGADRLSRGLLELEHGAGALESGLAEGSRRALPLQVKLRGTGTRATAAVEPLVLGAKAVHSASPHIFQSGYFVLSALDGARPRRRSEAAEAVSLGTGGQAARMLIVSDHGFNTAGSSAVEARLGQDADELATAGGFQAGVGGGAATVNAYGRATEARLPLVIGAFVLFSLLALIVVLRAPLLALLTVCLNLGSVAAAVGVMSLVAKIPAGYPLGGHPYIDTVGAGAIFGVTFGLSVDYAVFLLARMRERYDRDGDNRAAIAYGLEKTAGVITGAAAIMAAVFISFAAAPVATVSQMGVGLTVAILLDATAVRIVLLPALMLLIGDRVWAMPSGLERLLPRRRPLATEVDGPGI